MYSLSLTWLNMNSILYIERKTFIYLEYLWIQQLLLWQNHLSMDSQPLHCAKCNYTTNPSVKALVAHNGRKTWLISSWLLCHISWLVFHRECLPHCNYSVHGSKQHPRKGRRKWHKRHITKWELTEDCLYEWDVCQEVRRREGKVTLRVFLETQGQWWLWCEKWLYSLVSV